MVSVTRPAMEPAKTHDRRGGVLIPVAAEPFMPTEGTAALESLVFDLAREASGLSAQRHPVVRLSVAELVPSMNCYYSNRIEGHNTHPRDIDRAPAADYSTDPCRRDLQLEARAHIEVQRMIDDLRVLRQLANRPLGGHVLGTGFLRPVCDGEVQAHRQAAHQPTRHFNRDYSRRVGCNEVSRTFPGHVRPGCSRRARQSARIRREGARRRDRPPAGAGLR